MSEIIESSCVDEAALNDGTHDWLAESCLSGIRFYLSQRGMNRIGELKRTRDSLLAARDRAKRDAINNLARYKFSNFGYHAARWVTLNQLIGDKQPNPFKEFVERARTMPEGNRRPHA